VQELRIPSIAKLLAEKQSDGLDVRVVLENDYNFAIADMSPGDVANASPYTKSRLEEYLAFVDENGDGTLSPSELEARDAIYILREAKVPTLDDTEDGSRGSGLMHHKFVVIDNSTVVVSSANFTLSDIHGDMSAPDTRGNANSMVVIRDATVAKLFSQEFGYLWGDGPGHKHNSLFGTKKPYRAAQSVQLADGEELTVQFAPTSRSRPWSDTTSALIGRTLAAAHESVDMALFVFSEPKLADVLGQARKSHSLDIRALVEPIFAYRPYSQLLSMWALVSDTGSSSGAATHAGLWKDDPLMQSAGVPVLPAGDMLHHKFAVVDHNEVIMGSHNWTASAASQNEETLLVIKSNDVAAAYEREFNGLFAHSQIGPPQWLRDRTHPASRDASSYDASLSAAR
jgi:phosphatidylserine/phosphatidylglycerophosphate/cardiolipin synthase-like enzyme